MINKIYNKIKKYDVISFDIFDTLIFRYTETPSDVFKLVENNYNKKHSNKIKFKNERILAEQEARKKSKKEITINDIYSEMIPIYDKDTLKDLKSLEKKIEISCCYQNREMVNILKECIKNHKKVIITSDMYLDEETMKKILEKNDIDYNKLYLSSNIGLTKSTGCLFRHIIKDLKIKPEKMLHIGDNIKSDYIMARKNHINAYLYRRKSTINHPNFENFFDKENIDNLSLSVINNFIAKNNDNDDFYYSFGYKNLGPLVLGFSQFLNNHYGNKQIYFLSREGNFLKQCYDEMYPNNQTKYLYVSRKSISSNSLSKFKSFNEIFSSQSIMQTETIENFLDRFGLLNSKNIKLLKSNNIDIKNEIKNDKVFAFFEDNWKKFFKQADKTIFKDYLDQEGLKDDSIIVDVGWNGTMQNLISQKFKKKIKGVYLGIRNTDSDKQGYIFDNKQNKKILMFSRSMVGFLEILFSANHGTTLTYKRDGEKINPIIAENDIEKDEMKKILKIQEGALSFIKKFNNCEISKYIEFNNYVSFANLFEVGINPDNNIIKHFNDFYVFDGEKISFIGDKKNIYYFSHPHILLKEYINSTWKNAFLKRIFKLNAPYYLVFKTAYKRKLKK